MMNGENYGAVCATTEPEMAGRLMVHALKLAAGYDDISVVARGMEQMLNTPGELDLNRLMRFLGIKEKSYRPSVSFSIT